MILNDTYGFTSGQLAAPQANAMAAVIEPLMSGAGAPWLLYGIGAAPCHPSHPFQRFGPCLRFRHVHSARTELALVDRRAYQLVCHHTEQQKSKSTRNEAERYAHRFRIHCRRSLDGRSRSAALRFGGISFDYSAWWANPASEWLSLLMYVLLIIYMIKASMRIKK